MRRQDRDAIRKIMATRSDYRSDGQTSHAGNAHTKYDKENGNHTYVNNDKQSLFRKHQEKPSKSRHQLAGKGDKNKLKTRASGATAIKS